MPLIAAGFYPSRLTRNGVSPPVVEIVDTKTKIEAFMPTIDGPIKEGLATLEKVEIRFYRGDELS